MPEQKESIGTLLICLIKKLLSRNFILPVICSYLIFRVAMAGVDASILKVVIPALVVIATGYNGLGALAEHIRGKNGSKKPPAK